MKRNVESACENVERRKVVKGIIGGVTAVTAYSLLPAKWDSPLIESVFLPAHAATSGGNGNTNKQNGKSDRTQNKSIGGSRWRTKTLEELMPDDFPGNNGRFMLIFHNNGTWEAGDWVEEGGGEYKGNGGGTYSITGNTVNLIHDGYSRSYTLSSDGNTLTPHDSSDTYYRM